MVGVLPFHRWSTCWPRQDIYKFTSMPPLLPSLLLSSYHTSRLHCFHLRDVLQVSSTSNHATTPSALLTSLLVPRSYTQVSFLSVVLLLFLGGEKMIYEPSLLSILI